MVPPSVVSSPTHFFCAQAFYIILPDLHNELSPDIFIDRTQFKINYT